MLDALPVAVAVYAAEEGLFASCIVYVNEAFCALSGYERETLVGHSALLLAGARPTESTLRSLLPPVAHQSTWRKHRPDGSSYESVLQVTPLKDAAGRTTHFVAIEQDAHSHVSCVSRGMR